MSPAVPRRPPFAADRSVVLALLAAGVALRLAWLAWVHGSITAPLGVGEATRVALAYARTGVLADAYFDGQGPTAHLMPLHPIVAGTIIRLLGVGAAGTLALIAWALAQWAVAVVLLHRVAVAVEMPRAARLTAVGLLCLVPGFAPQEVVDFRFWEGGGALALAAGHLLLLVRAEAAPPPGGRRLAGIALLAGVTVLVSPPVAVAVGAAWGVLGLRRWGPARTAMLGGLTLLAAAAILAPWAARNAAALGAFVPLRSNAGLELAIANHPGALDGPAAAVFTKRLPAIHPFADPALHDVIRREGEVAYSRLLGAEARVWIAAHPVEAARLWLRRVAQFVFPPAWIFNFSGWNDAIVARALLVSVLDMLGLAGLVLGVAAGRRGSLSLALYLAALIAPFGLFQPTARYIYLATGVLTLPAAAVIVSLWGAGRRILQIGQPAHLAPPAHHRVEDQPAEQA